MSNLPISLGIDDLLTPQEKRLIDCAERGEWWISNDFPEFGPPTATQEAARTIRASVVRCLLTGEPWAGRNESWPVSTKGLMATGARIQGTLDLDGARLKRMVWLQQCAFTHMILLTDSKCYTVSLVGAHLPFGLDAGRTTVRGLLNLSEIVSNNEVNLAAARIEGQLACDGAFLENTGGTALNCNAITVGAGIFLRHGFTAKGEVNLRGAVAAGQLACVGGHFENAGGIALDCDAVTVGADVFLRDGFSAKGEVDLKRAKINGQLSCIGGRFDNDSGRALNCAGASVGADVFLCDGFSAKGEVNLVRAKIEGQLACDNGRFENANGPALACDSMTVGADVYLRRGFFASGAVILQRATIGGNLRCETATFNNGGGTALNLTLARVGVGLFFDDLKPAEGRPRGLEGRLVLDHTICRTFKDDRESWPAPDNLVLDGFSYERFQNCSTDAAVRREWLELQSKDYRIKMFRSQPWTQAIKVLRDMGHDDDARDLAIAREIARSRSAETKQSQKVWLWVQRYTTGFGYRPRYALYWSLLFFALGWLTFATAANLGYMAPRDGNVVTYLATHPGAKLPEHFTRFNAAVFALDNYLPIIELGQDQAWEPSDVQTGHERVIPDETAWERAVRLVLGHSWTITGARPMVEGQIEAAMPMPHSGFLEWVASGVAWAFSLGFHRLVYWTLEFLGWIFVSLYIAGMSGVMKDD